MIPITQPNWNKEGTRLSHGSAAMTNEFNDDVVAGFMNPRNDVGPSTQPTNVDENRRRNDVIFSWKTLNSYQKLLKFLENYKKNFQKFKNFLISKISRISIYYKFWPYFKFSAVV